MIYQMDTIHQLLQHQIVKMIIYPQNHSQKNNSRTYSKDTFRKQYFEYLLIIILFLVKLASAVDPKYPVTVGGFNGDTIIQQFDFTLQNDLLIGGITTDTQLITTMPTSGGCFVMFMKATDIIWTWSKQISTTVCTGNDELKSMSIRYDSQRAALLYSNTLLLILDLADGTISSATIETIPRVMQCTGNLACAVFYYSSYLNVIATLNTTPQKVGGALFLPDIAPFNSYYTLAAGSSPMEFRSHALGHQQVFVGLQSNGLSALVSWQLGFYSVYLAKVFSTFEMRLVDSIYSCYPVNTISGPVCGGQYFQTLYIMMETTSMEVYVAAVNTLSIVDFNQKSQVIISRPGTSSIQYLDIKAIYDYQVFFLIRFFDSAANDELYFFDFNCGYYGLYLNKYKLSFKSDSAVLTNAKVFTPADFQVFVSGSNPQDFYETTLNSGSPSQKTSFVYNFNIKENFLLNPESGTLMSATSSPTYTVATCCLGGTDFIAANAYTVLTPTDLSKTLVTTDMKQWPIPSVSQPYYLYQSEALNPLNDIYWLYDDSSSQTLTNTHTVGCQDACTQQYFKLTQATSPPGVTINLDSAAGKMTLVFTDKTLVGASQPLITLTQYGYMSTKYYSNSMFKQETHKIILLIPEIIPTPTTDPIIEYWIDDPAMTYPDIPLLPTTSYTENITATYPSMLGNPKLEIKYGLVLASDESVPVWLTYDTTTLKTVIKTNNENLDGTYSIKIVAWFNYNSNIKFDGTLLTVKLKDKCRKAIITPTTQFPGIWYYQVGEGPVDFPIAAWKTNYIDCPSLTYELTANAKPSAVSFVVSNGVPSIRIDTNLDSDHMGGYSTSANFPTQLTGTIYKTNPTDPMASSSQFIQYQILSTTHVYILPPPTLSDIVYVVGDPEQTVALPKFNKPASIGLSYSTSLVLANGNPIDTSFITYVPEDKIKIKTSSLSKIGEYELKMQAWFNIRIPYRAYSNVFKLTVLHVCTKNIITSRTIQNIAYNVTDVQLNIQVKEWAISKGQCAPVKYEASLRGTNPLPTFIKFDQSTLTFSIFAMSSQAVGQYIVQVVGKTEMFDATKSSLAQSFAVDITCFTKKVKPKMDQLFKTVYAGSLIETKVTFPVYDVWPICNDPVVPQFITYSARLVTGEPLPTYITLNTKVRTFHIIDDGTMVEGDVQVYIQGKALDNNVKSFSILNLKIKSGLGLNNGQYSKIPEVQLNVKPNEEFIYELPSVANQTDIACQVIKDDTSIKFIRTEGASVVIKASYSDIGSHQVQIMCGSSQGGVTITQSLKIKVAFPKDSKEFAKYLEVAAKIKKISRSGVVHITFNQEMQKLSNITLINNQSLDLRIKDPELPIGQQYKNINFTWDPIDFIGERTLKLQLVFQDPMSISVKSEDYLEVTVQERTLLVSKMDIMISSKYKMEGPIPRLMDDSQISKYVDSLAMKLQDGIDSLSSNSVLFNVIFGFIMSRLWGLINSMQIIVLMPLMSITFPANVQLVYYFINNNMNFQIIPIDLNAYGVFDFDKYSQKAYSPQFAEQGYNSLFMLENINENFMNFVSVLFFSGIVRILDLIFLHFEKQSSIIELLKNIFIYNFMIMVLLENSLQFILFSLINLLSYDYLSTPSQKASYFFSTIFILTLIVIAIVSVHIVRKGQFKENLSIRERNPKISALYELLRTSSKTALIYNSMFLFRRFLLSAVLIFMNDSKVGQLCCMIMISLMNALYFIKYRPIEDRAMNALEAFNEIIVLACYYHLLMFTEGLTDDVYLIYNVGWSMDILLLFQFFVNIISLFYNLYLKVKALFLRQLHQNRLRNLKAKIEQHQDSNPMKDQFWESRFTNIVDNDHSQMEAFNQTFTSQVSSFIRPSSFYGMRPDVVPGSQYQLNGFPINYRGSSSSIFQEIPEAFSENALMNTSKIFPASPMQNVQLQLMKTGKPALHHHNASQTNSFNSSNHFVESHPINNNKKGEVVRRGGSQLQNIISMTQSLQKKYQLRSRSTLSSQQQQI